MTLAEIYNEQLAWVLQTLRRLGVDERDVDDAAHDLFVVLHRKLSEFDPDRALRPWLFGIAYRVARDRLRSTQRRRLEPLPPTVGESKFEGQLAARSELGRIQRALATLDYERRATFVMHEFDGFTVPEIADALGLPLNTLYSHLRRARAQLHTLLVVQEQESAHGETA